MKAVQDPFQKQALKNRFAPMHLNFFGNRYFAPLSDVFLLEIHRYGGCGTSSLVIPLASRTFLIACPIGVKSKAK